MTNDENDYVDMGDGMHMNPVTGGFYFDPDEYEPPEKPDMEDKTVDELKEMKSQRKDEIDQLQFEKEKLEDEISERETSGHVTPGTFHAIAQALHNGESFSAGRRSGGYEDGVRENGFVHKSVMGRGALVGIERGEGRYIIAQIQNGSETVGRNSPRQQTRKNEYTKAEFKECEYTGDLDDVDGIQAAFEDGKSLDRGYINGYRVTRLKEVLNDIFKYYSDDE